MKRALRALGICGIAATAFTVVSSATALAPAAAVAAPAPTPGPPRILMVHVAHASALRAAIAAATAAGSADAVTVRRDFRAFDSFSVQVRHSEAAAISALSRLPGVTSVDKPPLRTFTDVTPATDDPYLGKELSYLNAVDAPAAWAQQQGAPTVKIAVVDSGIDVSHPDLTGKVVGSYNADHPGWSIADTVGHGTFVAGVAAADTDNGVGIAGAGYNVQLLGVKIAALDGSIPMDAEIAGIKWAADHGAQIMNLSLGGTEPNSDELKAIQYAQRKGVLVVAAAGNDGTSTPQYPAAYPGVLSVGATNPAKGTRASFSSYGSWVDVAAPGVGIYSTVPPGVTDLFSSKSGYASADGTSFAAPLVSGEAALLKSADPSATAAQLTVAIEQSAHGYQHSGLGHGQVDFDAALAHLPPTTTPQQVTTSGSSDTVQLSATSSAPAVRFTVSGGQPLPPVTVVNGQASLAWASYGYSNGPHTVTAVDCTAYGNCNHEGASTSLTLDNVAPQITSPGEHATVTGEFDVQSVHPAGGGVRLLLDGKVAGFAATSESTFVLSASNLTDGAHVLQTQSCSMDETYCNGPRSVAVTVRSVAVHPKDVYVAPTPFSPNHDGRDDTTGLRYTLTAPATVHIVVRNSALQEVASSGTHTESAGSHTWTWTGLRADGHALPDGQYLLTVYTSRGAVRGAVNRLAVIDTSAPTLTTPTGNGTLFYPYPDGYRDLFTPSTTLAERATLSLHVFTRGGQAVQTVSATRGPGAATLSWNGRDSHGSLVAAGTYRWYLEVTDAAGNTRRSATYDVRVSARRLVTKTAYLTRAGGSYTSAAGTSACASVHKSASAIKGGAEFVNACSDNGYDLAYAAYAFRVPSAYSYTGLAVQVRGYSRHHPSELTATVQRTDGELEITRYQKINSARTQWYTLATVPASEHITPGRYVYLTIVLDSNYRGRNDFDLGLARLRVTYLVLQ